MPADVDRVPFWFASDLLAGSRIMRPERDPGSGGALIPISAGIVGAEPRYRWRRTLLPATQIGEVVFVYIDRRWLPHLVQANGFRACRKQTKKAPDRRQPALLLPLTGARKRNQRPSSAPAVTSIKKRNRGT